jgi:dTDP-4-amino-4,6-dideoxygalactose transaminase
VAASRRDALRAHLSARGIPTGIYYPIPGHAQIAFESFEYNKEDFPESIGAAAEVLSLPMHTELTEDQQLFICESIRIFV